ncbi:putative serine racemase, Ammonia-lyase [Helianthus debilis subsp. tardiflorus]
MNLLVTGFSFSLMIISGAFKFRGESIMSIYEEQAAKGVVTHISCNHVATLALAAKLQRISRIYSHTKCEMLRRSYYIQRGYYKIQTRDEKTGNCTWSG